MMNEQPFQCPTCSQSFGKIQHLKRHASTHIDDKPHTCDFCGSEYKRSDALRRHWKSCTARLTSGNQIPKRSLSGRRKQACDGCTERKRACSQGQPCAECATRESECTYDRLKRRRSSENTAHPASESATPRLNDKISIILSTRRRFDFLLKFTHASGINQGYNCNRPFMTERVDTGNEDMPLSKNSTSNPWDYLLDEIPVLPEEEQRPLGLSRVDPTDDPLSVQCSRIWEMFRPFCQQDITIATVMCFFSPENVLHSLDVFWDRWYPHCPILYRPTFEADCCSPLLLMAMVLMGGCTSSSEADSRVAKSLLDIAEEIIFAQSIFSVTATGITGENHHEDDRTKVALLQATYFICIMQKWEGSDESKIRIQRDRFTRFVSTTRAIGLSKGTHKHQPIETDFDDGKWRKWIQEEEAVRTFNYVFLLDSAFVIFHNSVPRMVLQEMQIDLTSPEAWFQASSLDDFLSAVQSNPGASDKTISLADSVRRLCVDTSNMGAHFLEGASKLNLFTIATAIHGLIFHQKSTMYIFPFDANPLNKALDRWEIAWHSNSSQQSSITYYAETGFMQHADEFAVLARIHLELSYLSPKEWTELLGKTSEEHSRGRTGAFATFDQAGMGQVGDLMLAVEKLSLN